ncbi:hypothetical protein [Mycolicibacterium fortuitum]|nr:hypothetical protein [Mycolicibacterium fortuitum]
MIRRFFTDGPAWLVAFWLILGYAVLGLYTAEPAAPAPIAVEAVQP